MVIKKIHQELDRLVDPQRAEISLRFFKTGPGQYGEGDIFRGIRVPVLRKLAKKYENVSLGDAGRLLESAYHEDRLLALLLLVRIYARGDAVTREKVYRLYLEKTRFINNWDLVDLTAEHIIGAHLLGKGKAPLTRLAKSPLLWERRIAILATFHYIKQGRFKETLRIARILLRDPEDLIHKAVGWMLREVGKRNLPVEEKFLKTCYQKMPRTMLRYAIEKFPEPKRQGYLKGKT